MSDDGSAVSRPRDVLNLTNVGFEKTRTEMMSTITCVPAVVLFWCSFFISLAMIALTCLMFQDTLTMYPVIKHLSDSNNTWPGGWGTLSKHPDYSVCGVS